MLNSVIIALIASSLIFIIDSAISKANRKIENKAIKKKSTMLKTFSPYERPNESTEEVC